MKPQLHVYLICVTMPHSSPVFLPPAQADSSQQMHATPPNATICSKEHSSAAALWRVLPEGKTEDHITKGIHHKKYDTHALGSCTGRDAWALMLPLCKCARQAASVNPCCICMSVCVAVVCCSCAYLKQMLKLICTLLQLHFEC